MPQLSSPSPKSSRLPRTVLNKYFEANRYQLVLDERPIISKDDCIVVIMGPTGAGKTSFIQALTGVDLGVGHNLTSATSKVLVQAYSHPDRSGRNLVLVDTPGFDDHSRSDVDILETIAYWLAATYDKGIHVNGILLFHKISDNRMAGVSLKNLKMFRRLCGDESLKSVCLVSTMWDLVDHTIGEQREENLCSNPDFWQPMIQRRAQTARFMRTRESAIDIIMNLKGRRSSLAVQKELVVHSLPLAQTKAGQAVDQNLSRMAADHRAVMVDLAEEAKTAEARKDSELKKQINEDMKRSADALKSLEAKQKRLAKVGVWQKIARYISQALTFGTHRE